MLSLERPVDVGLVSRNRRSSGGLLTTAAAKAVNEVGKAHVGVADSLTRRALQLQTLSNIAQWIIDRGREKGRCVELMELGVVTRRVEVQDAWRFPLSWLVAPGHAVSAHAAEGGQ
jgi:hypothetical protein